MKTTRDFRVDELADRIGGRLVGDGTRRVSGVAALADASPDDITFFDSPKYAKQLAGTRAGALLTTRHRPQVEAPQILVPDPLVRINELIELFHPAADQAPPPGIDPTAQVSPSASIGDNVYIGPFAVIGDEAEIGSRSVVHAGVYVGARARLGADNLLWPNVVVREDSVMGDRVILHPGAVIGSDGFGYTTEHGRYTKIRHIGIVVIEDDVEIGANATIDRATLGRTIIKRGVKLDNLVHIGHNVEIGEDTVMAAQTGISGSTVIGRRVMMGGQVGLVDHLTVGDEALLVAQSGVIGDVSAGAKLSGFPARPHRDVLRAQAELQALPRLKSRVRALEAKLDALEKTLDDRARDSSV